MKYKIPLSKPALSRSDLNEIKKCFNSTWISSRSPWVDDFEKLFAKKVSNTKYAVSVNSGTSAIFLALKALAIGRKDEVILPSFTMIAPVNAVSLTGAKPVLVDSLSRNDWNINVNAIEKKITKKTKAIIPVHIYGYACDMERINRLARKHNLYVIEDAAEAMGTTYKGKRIGSLSHASCFSLYANKVITTGNGGVVATSSQALTEKIKRLRFFDFSPELHFRHKIIGYNLVLSGLLAALGLSQLRQFDKFLAKRREVFEWYKKYLSENKNLRFIEPNLGQEPNYWFPAIIFSKKEEKNKVVEYLEKKGIETRNFFIPVHLQPAYKKLFRGEKYKIAEYFYERGLLLPSYFDLEISGVKLVSSLINELF